MPATFGRHVHAQQAVVVVVKPNSSVQGVPARVFRQAALGQHNICGNPLWVSGFEFTLVRVTGKIPRRSAGSDGADARRQSGPAVQFKKLPRLMPARRLPACEKAVAGRVKSIKRAVLALAALAI